jgi:DNA-binding response OmpR family regulator
MNGIDLAIAMKKAVRDCRVLLFSGHAASVDLLTSARDAGHDLTILAKLIHPAELLARISELEMRPQPKQQAEVEIRQEETASG